MILKMKRRLTEKDVTRIVGKVLSEQQATPQPQAQTAQVSPVQKCIASIGSNKPKSCLNNDAGNCIKDLGRMVTNSDPKLVLPFAEAVKCLTPLISKA